MTREFYSHGKLLITGEYVVLDGALALAVPTKFGQSMSAKSLDEPKIKWTSRDHEDKVWFKEEFSVINNKIERSKSGLSSPVAGRLQQILSEANKLNPGILKDQKGLDISTKLEFPSTWGLGSSSTLLNNIASLFETDPFELLKNTFGGSGYDIAAAQNSGPITYQLNGEEKSILSVRFQPEFSNELFFVHLNQKQDSRKSIQHYQSVSKEDLAVVVDKISSLTQSFIACSSLEEFELLIEIHETLISQLLQIPKIKTSHFPDYPGAIKSLGGWGGDFILATGGTESQEYFMNNGYSTILSFDKMVKKAESNIPENLLNVRSNLTGFQNL